MAEASQPGLRPAVLKVRHAVITSLAVITPAAAILFLPIPIAANAEAAMPLSLLPGRQNLAYHIRALGWAQL